ncbi:hypothetical protein WJX74_008516 [Apatococcus lobatus]|uniref:RNA-binding S4 domain-containing protein n=2 Tax=Apatococcus TaxID=904362 RepID=A0AAW1SYX5_9CHLO
MQLPCLLRGFCFLSGRSSSGSARLGERFLASPAQPGRPLLQRHSGGPRKQLLANLRAATSEEGVFTKSATSGPGGQARASRKKQRLDEACQALRPELSRNVIQSWISLGKVQVDGKVISKAGAPVPAAADVQILAELPKFVCRAGQKLEAALDHFKVDVTGLTALDSGLSTGGFADCLLQRGAVHVYGVDVGYGQVAEKLRQDERLTVLDRTNLRYLTQQALGNAAPLDLATLDLSFISVLKVMPAVCSLLNPQGQLIVLIKPQFEAGKSQVGAGGVVRDPAVHKAVIESTINAIVDLGFTSSGWIESPIKGSMKGNTEFLAHFSRLPLQPVSADVHSQ